MAYETPSCAYCPDTIRACRDGEEKDRGPGWCPTKVDPEGVAAGIAKYDDPFIAKVAQVSSRIEAEGYCEWTRVEETVQFAKQMGFTKLGIVHCIGSMDMAITLSAILESHGFQVVSVCCKTGGVPKENLGLKDEEKIKPGQFEAMCNPITQAELLNRAETELNIMVGLCVGHDSMFFRYVKALTTVLVAKDRVLAHNPAGALHLANGYFKRVWGPDRPEKPHKKPAEGRR
jgi:uncharacterized metal-binding protein